jgi:hypothetical protein
MVFLFLWGCVRTSPIQVALPDPSTSCAIPAEGARISVTPPEGRVFQVSVTDDPALRVWLRTGADTGRVVVENPLRFSGESTLSGSVTLSSPLENAAASLPAGSTLARVAYGIGGVDATRRLGGAVPLMVTIHHATCGVLQYTPDASMTPVREVEPEEPGRFYVLSDDVLLSATPGGPTLATLSPARSEAYVRVITLDTEIAEIAMTFADGAWLRGWISREPLSRFSVEPPEDDSLGFRMLEPEPPLPPPPDGISVTLPAGLPISALPGAEPWAEVAAPVRATVQRTDTRGWVIVQQLAGLDGLLAATPEQSIAWVPARRLSLPD